MKQGLKKWLSVFMAGTICMSMGASLVGCGSNDDDGTEKIDEKRTQLYVYNFNGGYGTSWLEDVKARYEEKYKDTKFEDGKTGIQVYITSKKELVDTSSVVDGRNEVFFTEQAYYYALLNEGVLGDMTEAVTGDLSVYGDKSGSTIESKMTAEQKKYFGVEKNGETHYYGIPHYSGYAGLIYNVDMFNENNYYFTANPYSDDLADQFIFSPTETKSAGPNGISGDYDDGLPATYEQFFQLCEWISQAGQIPVLWTGAHAMGYLDYLCNSLAVDYEGLEQTMLNYTLSGTAKNLGSINASNQFVLDEEDTDISDSNGNELARQAGKYYALTFLEKLIRYGEGKYHNSNAFSTTFTHLDAQDDFLYAGNDGTTPETAMLVDGIWWQSEATQTFNDIVADKGSSYSKKNRNFAFMPLPKATAEQAGGVTLYDHVYSMCFIKPNMASWKQEIALDFIKFINTDESLIKFTQITDTPRALNYTMDATQKAELTPFARSVVEMKERADIVYPYSTNATYINNQSFFTGTFYSTVDGVDVQYAARAFHESNTSVAKYFKGIKSYRDKNWNSIIR